MMSRNVTLEVAQATLGELITNLPPGEEVVITHDDRPVAKLIGQQPTPKQPRQPGSAKGILVILAEDDEHLQDFREYLQ